MRKSKMKLCGTKRGQGLNCRWLKMVIITTYIMRVKPQAINQTKLFVKSGDNFTTLWETVVVSNANVHEHTKMFGKSIIIPILSWVRHNNGNG